MIDEASEQVFDAGLHCDANQDKRGVGVYLGFFYIPCLHTGQNDWTWAEGLN